MKEYRKHLIFESVVLGILSAVLLIVQILAFQQIIQPIAGDSHWVSFWNGMMGGASMGIMVLFILGIVVNIRALCNETRLKKLHAKENDERVCHIQMKAQSMGMRISVPLMLAGGIVLGYFDIGMSIVCICCAFVQSVITVLCKLYWHHAL